MTRKEIELDIDGDGETDVKIEGNGQTKVWLNLTSLRKICIVVCGSIAGLFCYTQI